MTVRATGFGIAACATTREEAALQLINNAASFGLVFELPHNEVAEQGLKEGWIKICPNHYKVEKGVFWHSEEVGYYKETLCPTCGRDNTWIPV